MQQRVEGRRALQHRHVPCVRVDDLARGVDGDRGDRAVKRDDLVAPREPLPLFNVAGVKVGISICEDAWSPAGPILAEAAGGAELIVNLNASPYYAQRLVERETMLATRAADASVPILYANLVGGQDELVFDGASLVFDEQGMLIARAKQFVTDLLVVDIDVVRENYLAFAKALPDTRVFYAVKANPAPEILKLLAELGSSFDVASVSETEAVLAAGATPDRISYGNTIKKELDIVRAYELGVDLFAVDSIEEVEKIARAAPAARVIARPR